MITIIKARASFSGHVNTTGFLRCWFKVKHYLIKPKLPFKSLGHAQCCARLNSLSEQCNSTGKHYSVMFTQGGKYHDFTVEHTLNQAMKKKALINRFEEHAQNYYLYTDLFPFNRCSLARSANS